MPKKKTSQPELIREERAEYKITPEEQKLKDAYHARLRAFLEDPASRQIEGFPIGEIDDILALSDPPYYTACPNPFLAEIIEQWQKERPTSKEKYHREPFATDVSEGKNDPIYNAHSYHTKVPHKAIMRYILHYTEPGDIVFDGFCGTGMTGVAAQLCGDKKTVESMGYRVTDKGEIYEGNKLISTLGERQAILSDLSPAATFIAYNYNTPINASVFERESKHALSEVEDEFTWMFETTHKNNKNKGKINYTIWSDVFICPNCSIEMNFWDVAVNQETYDVSDTWKCPSCKILLSKDGDKESGSQKVERAWQLINDRLISKNIRIVKQVPSLIHYKVEKNKYLKKPSQSDMDLLLKIENYKTNYKSPLVQIPKGDKTNEALRLGFTHHHHFYTTRNLLILSAYCEKLGSPKKFINVASISPIINKMYRFRSQKGSLGAGGGPLSGTIYIPSLVKEIPILKSIKEHIAKTTKVKRLLEGINPNVISTSSHTSVENLQSNSIDYIFTDPPFGSNLNYSELNFLSEGWLGVFTNNTSEAIISRTQHKKILEYQDLMVKSFKEACRILKPGHWITVEFHNSKNAVWTAIQEAVLRAGFIVADVRTFDKKQGSYNQVIAVGAVKQDLVISAYKPNDNLEERFRLEAGTIDGAWDFVRYHLTQLPLVVEKRDEIEVVAERQAFLLFDRMVAFHIQRGASVPLSAGEFYAGLKQKFVERDGMYFLPDQVAEYDSARLRLGRVAQLTFMVSDEKSAIQWLRQQLDPTLGGKPQTFADLQPKFMPLSRSIAKHEDMPDLGIILDQNFLEDESGHWRAPDPSKATDLERLRLKALLREFDEYVKSTGRLKQFRTEAVRAGFAEAYKKREYKVILEVAGRLPESVLHEDPDLLMYFDTATLRTGQ